MFHQNNYVMKKLLVLAFVALMSLTASAQVYLGGEVGFWRDHVNNQTEFSLVPEVGYSFNDRWAAGISLGYAYNYNGGFKLNGFEFAPYSRFTAVEWNKVSIFIDGCISFSALKDPDLDSSYMSWDIGFKPGVKVALTDNLSFLAHLGFLGYRDCDDAISGAVDTGVGFKFSSHDLKFGLYYNF